MLGSNLILKKIQLKALSSKWLNPKATKRLFLLSNNNKIGFKIRFFFWKQVFFSVNWLENTIYICSDIVSNE